MEALGARRVRDVVDLASGAREPVPVVWPPAGVTRGPGRDVPDAAA
ncbi:MAG: hypothetical protein IT200_04890 [Thermoleophilia bacterium]|nr:hypothetical protein [Thermoleophilia bacterium]